MRKYFEPTMKNLLRVPLVLGVPFTGLLALSFLILAAMLLTSGSKIGNTISLTLSVFGYAFLAICTKFMAEGWIDELLYPIEKFLKRKKDERILNIQRKNSDLICESPDALDRDELVRSKDYIVEFLKSIKPKQDCLLELRFDENGAIFNSLEVIPGKISDLPGHLYSLVSLPVVTDPLFISNILNRLAKPFSVYIRISGQGFYDAKKKIETSRRRNSKLSHGLSNIDSEVTFEESSRVLQAMSRGEETICQFSFVIFSENEQADLDESLLKKEKNLELCLRSILALRKPHFRGHFIRLVTASDLIPNLLDPKENSTKLLKTFRGNPLYFSPCDPRLDALHWLVLGATGTGKSFFTGLILARLIDSGTPMSVLFVDHNRSFRRFVKNKGGVYLEPTDLAHLEVVQTSLYSNLSRVGTISGIELSDLVAQEKKEAALLVLSGIESFLRNRNTIFPIYIVLDECWNFIRDEPILVQRAFREFRKLNGAVIAISQSLSDFLGDPTGKSIIQNTPIRVLLRQGEDVTPYKSTLCLNLIEAEKLRMLSQKKSVYSEVLIKTPFLSKFGRLYPTKEEHALLRTDNIREEMIAESYQREKVVLK